MPEPAPALLGVKVQSAPAGLMLWELPVKQAVSNPPFASTHCAGIGEVVIGPKA